MISAHAKKVAPFCETKITIMTENELDNEIEYILNVMQETVGVTNSMFPVADHFLMHRQMSSADAFYVADKLEFYGLCERRKYRGDLWLTAFGREVIRDGGWLAYLEEEGRKQRAELDRELRSSRLVKTQSKVNTVSTAISALAAVAALAISLETMNKADDQVEKKDKEIATLKTELRALSTQIRSINAIIDRKFPTQMSQTKVDSVKTPDLRPK